MVDRCMRTDSSHCDPSHISLDLRSLVIRLGSQLEESFLTHLSTIRFSLIPSLEHDNKPFPIHFIFQILTKDSVTVTVDAVVYWRTSNPMISVTNVENASRSTQLLAQTTLRNILGTKTLGEILSDRENISAQMQVCIASKFVLS